MKRVEGSSGVSLFECVNPVKNKWRVRWDVQPSEQEGNASYTLIIEGKEQIRNVYCPHNYQLEIEQLGRCIIEGETPVVTADFSIKNAKILDAILQEIGYFESNVM